MMNTVDETTHSRLARLVNADKRAGLTAPDFLRVTVWSLDRQGRGLYTRYQLR
ncbi:hypothetical protein [Chromobacterium violaceum]|uniref:hypothetical protein n=1 Tax=Chromobacterium violaceum TaxID=536 RepID=UPI0012D41ECA|nr:hypothetical protein [Chromobacterium violaceum]